MIKSFIISIILFTFAGCSTLHEPELNPTKVPVQLEKAQALTSIGNNFAKNNLLTQATEKYLQAIKEYPTYSAAHYSLGRLLLRRGFKNKGVASIKKAIDIDSNHTQAKNFLSSFYYKQGRYKEALKYSISASKDIIYPNQEETLTQLAMSYEKLNKKKEALLNIKRALSARPKNCQNRFNIAKFFYNRGFVTTSIKVARQADVICHSEKEKNSLLFLKALIFYKSENYLISKKILNSIQTKQNNLRRAIPKLLTKIDSKTGL